jgi:deoxyribodipyrimidine photo-lyase
MSVVMWFRKDLRVQDNPALRMACDHAEAQGTDVRAVFIITPGQYLQHGTSTNQLDFMRQNLVILGERLHDIGIPLDVISCTDFEAVPDRLAEYAHTCGLSALYANTEIEWNERKRDEAVRASGLPMSVIDSSGILPLGDVRNLSGERYKVFTPYSRRWFERAAVYPVLPLAEPNRPTHAPKTLSPLSSNNDALAAWHPVPTALVQEWQGGESAAHEALARFVAEDIVLYPQDRDMPNVPGTSQLSHYLAMGILSPRQCLAAVMAEYPDVLVNQGSPARPWVRQLVWREFYVNLMREVPRVARGGNYQALGDLIPWRSAPDEFQAWAEGRTGYPLVDAAMRQLVQTGWMHNRLRMVAASFLAKHLLIDWRRGEAFFAAHLIDGDYAANNGGWQWSAGTGCDAQPYFRMFNPSAQGMKFDPQAAFIRQFVPELAAVPAKAIHGMAGLHALSHDQSYPEPMVDHREARARALASLAVLKKSAAL